MIHIFTKFLLLQFIVFCSAYFSIKKRILIFLKNFIYRGFVSFDDVKDIRKELMKQRAEMYGKRVSSIGVDEEEEYDE